MDLSQARNSFLIEARELLQQFENLLLKAESEPLDKEDLNALFRSIHTIKGSAGLFGFETIVSFTHDVENVLDALRNQKIALDPPLVNLLLECRDAIENLVSDTEQETQIPLLLQDSERALQLRLSDSLKGGGSIKPVLPVIEEIDGKESHLLRWQIHARFGSESMRNGIDPIACLRYLATLGSISEMHTHFDNLPSIEQIETERCYTSFDFVLATTSNQQEIDGAFDFAREGGEFHLFCLNPQSPQSLPPSLTHQTIAGPLPDSQEVTSEAPEEHETTTGKAPVRNADYRFLKVESAKLDHLINLVGELVIAGASATVQANKLADESMQESISVMSSLVEMIRDGALNMRMVPVGDIFQRFPRVVRDVSHELGKEIELKISGEETELDKSMVEKLTDPLMHIVRNALDHGIEPPEERIQAGKPAGGSIALTAYHESGSVVIEIKDDGRGIQHAKVIKRAQARGMIRAGQHLNEAEIYRLLFEPGFSTQETATNLSGRGVGMDVVRKNVEALRGEIEIHSQEGLGTTISLRLPLTLAIINGFLVKVGGSHFVIPLDMVVECIELVASDSPYHHYLELRGEVLPYVDIRDLFDIDGTLPKWRYIVVVQYGNRRAGFVVDSLQGELQVVIKPLGKLFRRMRGLSGSAILGTGEVALIMDVPQLVQYICRRETIEVNDQASHGARHESKHLFAENQTWNASTGESQ